MLNSASVPGGGWHIPYYPTHPRQLKFYKHMKSFTFAAVLLHSLTGFGQTTIKFNTTLQNNSDSKIYYSYLNVRDSLKANEYTLLRKQIKPADFPFLLFIYTPDTSSSNRFHSREIRIFSTKEINRKIIIDKNKKVKFLSHKSELLYDSFALNSRNLNFRAFTDNMLKSHKNDAVSSEIISTFFCRSGYPIDTIQYYYSILSKNIQQTNSGQQVLNYIKSRKRLNTGSIVENFSLRDSSNRLINLADITSDYILLDFWFSSCKPCIESFPALKELYKQTSRNQFEIVALSVDDEARFGQWISAIKKYELPWINLLDKEYLISYYTFAIETYPTKILLNKERRIISINPGEPELKTIIEGKQQYRNQ